jgi:YVTN family beta-propeller protein
MERVSGNRTLLIGLAALLTITQAGAAQTHLPALLVLEKDDRTLAIIDPTTQKILGRAPAGEDPHEVTVTDDGTVAYISNYGAFRAPQHTLSVVDLASQKALPPVDLGPLLAPHGLEFADGKVYFTAEGSKAIGYCDPSTRRIEWVLGVGQNRSHMVIVARDASRIFTSNVNSDSISIFDRDKKGDASGWVQSEIPVGKGPEGFDVSPDGREIWAANSNDGTVSIIDVASRKVTQTVDVRTRHSNRLKFTPDGRRALISDLGTGDLVVLDAASRKELKRISLGRGAAGILIEPGGARAYVAVSPNNQVAILDLETLTVAGRIDTGKGPDGMAWAVRK